jgi:hypothetical protein
LHEILSLSRNNLERKKKHEKKATGPGQTSRDRDPKISEALPKGLGKLLSIAYFVAIVPGAE